MSNNFAVTYMAGGRLDELPHPLFPRKSVPHIIGRNLIVPATQGVYTDSFTTTAESEYLCIAVACSVYTVGDFWEFSIGGVKLCDTVFVKGLPESISVGNTMVMIYPVPANTEVTFTYNNAYNIEKTIFYNLHFLE